MHARTHCSPGLRRPKYELAAAPLASTSAIISAGRPRNLVLVACPMHRRWRVPESLFPRPPAPSPPVPEQDVQYR